MLKLDVECFRALSCHNSMGRKRMNSPWVDIFFEADDKHTLGFDQATRPLIVECGLLQWVAMALVVYR
jgi:hypothetical protein